MRASASPLSPKRTAAANEEKSGRADFVQWLSLRENVDHIDRLKLAGDTDRHAFVRKLVNDIEKSSKD